jgi:hypothetical protein
LNSPARTEAEWKDQFVIGLLIVLTCLIMVNSSSVMDTALDIYTAWQIASGNNFPLERPMLGGLIHIGPIWFYVLALPMIFTKNWVAISVWVGLLSGFKYALAYACGQRLGSRNLGLIWACLLAIPNWTAINYLVFTHINLVETAVLFSFYSFIRWHQGERHWFLIMCLSVGIGVHTHPSFYAVGLAFIPMIATTMYRKQLSPGYVVLGVLAATMPFIPYFISQHLQQWPDLHASGSYLESQAVSNNWLGFLDVSRGALVDGPIIALRYVLNLHGLLLWLSYVLIVLVMGVGFYLAVVNIIRFRRDNPAVLLLGATVVIIAGVTFIRAETPYYMTLVIYPPFCGLVAWGWSKCNFLPARPVKNTLVVLGVASLFGFSLATFAIGRSGHLQVSDKAMHNVRSHAVNEVSSSVYFPAWARSQLGAFICGLDKPAYFHGTASLLLEQSYALEAKMHCDTNAVYIGGKGDGQHFLGVSVRDAGRLGIASTGNTIGPLNLQKVTRIIAPDDVEKLPDGDVYPPRQFFHSESLGKTIDFTSGQDEMLAITNLYHYWMPYSFQVFLNGTRREPIFANELTSYFRCTQCSANDILNWRIVITAPKPELVEVVTFTPSYTAGTP